MEISMSSALSGMQVAGTRLEVSGNNVANINTAGFSASRVNQVAMPSGGVAIGSIQTIPNSDTQTSGTDLATESVAQIEIKNVFGANGKVIKTQDEMIGTLLDLFA